MCSILKKATMADFKGEDLGLFQKVLACTIVGALKKPSFLKNGISSLKHAYL